MQSESKIRAINIAREFNVPCDSFYFFLHNPARSPTSGKPLKFVPMNIAIYAPNLWAMETECAKTR